ncbi:GNAT family N-acetyltransferase [Gallaecimonas mangrovi]|uniref:GNAT family N-acetyltransferase n=1 Tax=Gallaecimonas mangrovi TaxID=2291597 RepID=UPI001867DDB3|nr:GNAT family N-acetyltransferase [Gallaecimonas mangrovi]
MSQFSFTTQQIDLASVTLSGPRLTLRPVSDMDAEVMFNEFSPAVTRYMMPKPAADISETRAFISNSLALMAKQQELVLAITDNDSGDFLGVCGMHGRGTYHQPELGLWLKMAAHGNGYGREAIWQLCHWMVKNVDFDYAVYPVDKANIPSRRIPESLGGIIAGEVVKENMAGVLLDEVVYHLSKARLAEVLG